MAQNRSFDVFWALFLSPPSFWVVVRDTGIASCTSSSSVARWLCCCCLCCYPFLVTVDEGERLRADREKCTCVHQHLFRQLPVM